ncbi:MAG: hypothetical protein AAGA57_11090 [Planctomycetota bacterium]
MKTLLKVGLVLAVLLIAAVALVFVFSDRLIEAGLEKGLAYATETEVEITDFDLQPFAGRVTMAGLTMGHPAGFSETGPMLNLTGFDLAVDTASMNGDTPHVKNLIVQGLVIELRQEGDKINLFELHRRLNELSGKSSAGTPAPAEPQTPSEPSVEPSAEPPAAPESGGDAAPAPAPTPEEEKAEGDRRLRIDELKIKGVKLRATGIGIAGVTVPDQEIPLPDLELANLEGKMSDITLQVVEQLAESTASSLGLPSVAEVQALAEEKLDEARQRGEQAVNEAVQQGEQAADDARNRAEEAMRQNLPAVPGLGGE